MAELLASKVVVVEEEPRVRGIPSASTSVVGAVGLTERGPIDEAVLCSSFEEYGRIFGGFTPDSDLALAAAGFFENGGTALWVVRTAHHTDVADPASATAVRGAGFLVAPGSAAPAILTGAASAPFALSNGERLVLSLNGGADVDTVFNGSRASVVAGAVEPYALAGGETLTFRVDGGREQTATLFASDFVDIANARAAELSAALNAAITGGRATLASGAVRISSDTEGTASQIEITGGTANARLQFPTAPVRGGGNVADLKAVSIAEVDALVQAALSGVEVSSGAGHALELRTTATGAGATLQARAGTAAAFGLDVDLHSGSATGSANALRIEGKDPGAYANVLEVEVQASFSSARDLFDLSVIDDGVVRETFRNLSMDPASPAYVERVINNERQGSVLIRVIDQLLAGQPAPAVQTITLAGGDDGFVDLDDNDFIGSPAGKTGLYALDRVPDMSLLIVPGRATPAVHNAMLRYAEVDRSGTIFAVLDPPENTSAAEIVIYVESTAALLDFSEFGAIYWPRVKVLNPQRSVFGSSDRIVVPPSGIICGVFSRTDSARPGGVYDPPAGVEAGRMFGVLGFETDEVLEERKRDLVYPKRINPLTTGPGLPRFIDGSRTLKGGGNFPYVAERRGVIFIERSLRDGLQFARHKNNTEGLRAQVRRTITAFLLTQMNNGAFRSRDPAKAFFVDVSDQLNTPAVIFVGQLIVRVGLATNKPAEFIVLRISQDTRALEAELAATGA